MKTEVAVHPTGREFHKRAKALAKELDAEVVESLDLVKCPFVLRVAEKLSLSMTNEEKMGALSVDFDSPKATFRRKFGRKKGTEGILRAIGKSRKILDATAGLGRDAFVLASHNCCVTACEISPIVAALLDDGLQRAKMDFALRTICESIQLYRGDSLKLLEASQEDQYDCVYLDPMFPKRSGGGRPKKEIWYLQRLFEGQDPRTQELLELALRKSKRVVVKQPARGDGYVFLKNRKPQFTVRGSSINFDVYIEGPHP